MNNALDLGGFNMVVSVRQEELDRKFRQLYNRIPSQMRNVQSSLQGFYLIAQLRPHQIKLYAEAGQTKQAAYMLANFQIREFRGPDSHIKPDRSPFPIWSLAYKVNIHFGDVKAEDYGSWSLQADPRIKAHMEKLNAAPNFSLKKTFFAFGSESHRDHFYQPFSNLPAGLTEKDMKVLLELIDQYFKTSGIWDRQNILAMTPFIPKDFSQNTEGYEFWPTSLETSITYNPRDNGKNSTLNYMMMNLFFPSPKKEDLENDKHPAGKIFYTDDFQAPRGDVSGIFRYSRDLFVGHGFLNLMRRVGSHGYGQNLPNWRFHPIAPGHYRTTFRAPLEKGQASDGNQFEFYKECDYQMQFEDFNHPTYGKCVKFTFTGDNNRFFKYKDFLPQSNLKTTTVLYISYEGGRLQFHDDPAFARSKRWWPELLEEHKAEFARTTDYLQQHQIRYGHGPLDQGLRERLSNPNDLLHAFHPECWSELATPMFMPISNQFTLRNPHMVYDQGFDNFTVDLSYKSLETI